MAMGDSGTKNLYYPLSETTRVKTKLKHAAEYPRQKGKKGCITWLC